MENFIGREDYFWTYIEDYHLGKFSSDYEAESWISGCFKCRGDKPIPKRKRFSEFTLGGGHD